MSPPPGVGMPRLPRAVVAGARPTDRNALVLEGWAEGFMIGGLLIMAGITMANMRRGQLLHKLILLEILGAQLVIGGWQSFNLFWPEPTYGWWLSTAAVGLHVSTQLHSVIAWLKLRPFLSRRGSRLFIGTVILVQPYWVLEIYATFQYFTDVGGGRARWLFPRTRPVETLFRDPWWVAACGKFLWVLKSHYDLTLRELVAVSPRFAVMLAAMALSVAFVVLDILSVTATLADALPVGVNPFWKLALVFKCLTDTVVLDDFKTALDRLWQFRRTSLAAGGSPPAATVATAAAGAAAGPYARQPSAEGAGRSSTNDGRKRSGSRGHAEHILFLSSPRHELELAHFEVPPLPAAARA